jgi:hypothetical protein
MMSDYTKGPWHVGVSSTHCAIFGPDDRPYFLRGEWNKHVLRAGEAAANARLIAAAPDLLASVKEFLAIRQAMIDLGGAKEPFDKQMIHVLAEMQGEVVDRAKLAIQKATEGK